jgi:hypothetical protein
MIKVYEISTAKIDSVKNILEAPDQEAGELDVEIEKNPGKGDKEKAKSWKVNEFKKQGYILREAKALGIEKKVFYLQISADEDFFKRNELMLLEAGAKTLNTADADSIIKKINDLESSASNGIGFIFG